ncbi:MAG: class I SAM-dependent methyltransferase [Candidatus Saccharibacteria bacterium]
MGATKTTAFHSIDFAHDSLAKTLIRSSSFDPTAKSFFSWLGVTMYLSTEEVFSILRSIHDIAPAGSMVVFDYYDVQELIAERASVNLQKKEEMMRKLGEPMKTGFEPSKLDLVISELGFLLYENLSPTGIEERYFVFGKNSYSAHKNVHLHVRSSNRFLDSYQSDSGCRPC